MNQKQKELNEVKIDGKIYVPKGTEKKQIQLANVEKGLTYCIVRTHSAGVFAGFWNRKIKGKEGTVYNSRRIWYWDGANSLSQLAMDGTLKPDKCKFAKVVPETDLKEVIEVIPCTTKAKTSIGGVSIWEQ